MSRAANDGRAGRHGIRNTEEHSRRRSAVKSPWRKPGSRVTATPKGAGGGARARREQMEGWGLSVELDFAGAA